MDVTVKNKTILEPCNSWWWDGCVWQFYVVLWTVFVAVLSSRVEFCFVFLQRIRSTVEEREQKQLLMDLDVVMRSNSCSYIVQFYGALFKEVSDGTTRWSISKNICTFSVFSNKLAFKRKLFRSVPFWILWSHAENQLLWLAHFSFLLCRREW